MPDITRLLGAAAAGDRKAAADLLPLVYDELRKLATARIPINATVGVHYQRSPDQMPVRRGGPELLYWRGVGHSACTVRPPKSTTYRAGTTIVTRRPLFPLPCPSRR